MDHESMRDNVSALLDDELEGAPKSEAEAHLAACAECRAFAANWNALSRKLFRPAPVAVSEAFVQKVMARVAPERKKATIIPVQWFVPAIGVAAAFLFAVLPTAEAMTVDALIGETAGSSAWTSVSSNRADEALTFVMEGQ